MEITGIAPVFNIFLFSTALNTSSCRPAGTGLIFTHMMFSCLFQEVDTALLKLYAETNAPELEAFIVAGEITCDVKDCCDWLEKSKCYHALALLHRHAHDHDKALKVWAKIISGQYKDDSFHGLEFFVECLAKYV
jgi:elongation factor P--beta-lysine ligase